MFYIYIVKQKQIVMISIKEYVEHLMNVRNEFYAVNNIEAAEKVQADINQLILSETNK